MRYKLYIYIPREGQSVLLWVGGWGGEIKAAEKWRKNDERRLPGLGPAQVVFIRSFSEFLEVSEFGGTAESSADGLAASNPAPASEEARGRLEFLHLAGTAT